MHDDYIHDIAFDYYGKRLASCSSDQYIKVPPRHRCCTAVAPVLADQCLSPAELTAPGVGEELAGGMDMQSQLEGAYPRPVSRCPLAKTKSKSLPSAGDSCSNRCATLVTLATPA
jgi:hypothetical protein